MRKPIERTWQRRHGPRQAFQQTGHAAHLEDWRQAVKVNWNTAPAAVDLYGVMHRAAAELAS
jgi:hypothetical protein